MVGRFVGETGLAAVSSASTLCFLLNAVCMGFSAGGTVLTARARGAGDRLEEEEAAACLLYTSYSCAKHPEDREFMTES